MSNHSSLVGGSNADRLLQCPGSWKAIMALPPSVDKPSDYALEGSALHEIMAALMTLRVDKQDADLYQAAQDMVGDFVLDRELTQELVDTAIYPTLDALRELEAIYGDGFAVVAVERSVDFPEIPSARGTVDLILSSQTHILHVDFKFGQGIQVKAVYPDPAGDTVNSQLLFYTAAAMHSAKGFYRGKKKLVAAIIQPRADVQLSHTEVTRQEIKWFIEDVKNAVIKAIGRDPPLKKGEACRWCPAKIACPLWTAPMLILAETSDARNLKRTDIVSDQVSEFGKYLASAKHLVDMLTLYKKEVDEQLHAYLEDGGKVPGWRLKQKVRQRIWIDEEIVEEKLRELGFESGDIWQKKLQTFAKTDAVAKRLGVEIPAHLRELPATNETTVCRDDDPAPVVTRPLAIEQFRAALAALKTA